MKMEKVSGATGVSPEDVLMKWNSECPAEAKVAGNKRLCCMNILKNLGPEPRALLIDHASKYGAKSAFTDDAKSACQTSMQILAIDVNTSDQNGSNTFCLQSMRTTTGCELSV